MVNYKFIVSGLVQGVSYRRSISSAGKRRGYSGFVKNLPDGTVEVGVSLEDDDFTDFIQILETGSKTSKTDGIDQSLSEESFSGEFEIRY